MERRGKGWLVLLACWVVLAALFSRLSHRPGPELEGCRANLKRIGVALELYSLDHGGERTRPVYPDSLDLLVPSYLEALPTCPAARRDTYSRGYEREGPGYRLVCRGRHHERAGLGPDEPVYDWIGGLRSGSEGPP